MSIAEPFSPQEVFLGKDAGEKIVPNVLISSQRYIQGDGVIAHLGRYLSIIQSIRPAIVGRQSTLFLAFGFSIHVLASYQVAIASPIPDTR